MEKNLKKSFKNKYSFTRMKAVSNNHVVVSAMLKKHDVYYPSSRIFEYKNGEWSSYDLDVWVNSIELIDGKPMFLSNASDIIFSDDLGKKYNIIEELKIKEKRKNIAWTHKLKKIDNQYYVCGSGKQTYYSTTGKHWNFLDEASHEPEFDVAAFKAINNEAYFNADGQYSDEEHNAAVEKSRTLLASTMLWSCDGGSETDLYFVGGGNKDNTALLHWDGSKLSQSPINKNYDDDDEAMLVNVLYENEETVWVCGHYGALLKGNHKTGFRWEEAVDLDDIFYDMAKFNGALYLGSPTEVYRYDGNAIVPVSFGSVKKENNGASVLEAIDDVLWIMSENELLRFDGKTWESIPLPSM